MGEVVRGNAAHTQGLGHSVGSQQLLLWLIPAHLVSPAEFFTLHGEHEA